MSLLQTGHGALLARRIASAAAGDPHRRNGSSRPSYESGHVAAVDESQERRLFECTGVPL